jgi:hypothetical protein
MCSLGKFDSAERAIKFYREAEKKNSTTGYEFTSILNTLLNVFSCILPNNDFEIKLEPLLSDVTKIPKFEESGYEKTKEGLDSYFRHIRNGLAHKTETNFVIEKDITKGNSIVNVKISSHNDKSRQVEFTLDDLNKILKLLEGLIKEQAK